MDGGGWRDEIIGRVSLRLVQQPPTRPPTASPLPQTLRPSMRRFAKKTLFFHGEDRWMDAISLSWCSCQPDSVHCWIMVRNKHLNYLKRALWHRLCILPEVVKLGCAELFQKSEQNDIRCPCTLWKAAQIILLIIGAYCSDSASESHSAASKRRMLMLLQGDERQHCPPLPPTTLSHHSHPFVI